jgi:hypothetical protein
MSFKNYMTYEELYYHYPRIEEWVDNSHVTQVLNSAASMVAADLRRRGVDTQRVYIPLMFDSTPFGTAVAVSDTTSTSITVVSERRFVVEITSVTTNGCYIEIEGSSDNVHFVPVKMLDGHNATIQVDVEGLYNRSFVEGYKYIRYIITGSASLFAYCVDTSFDQLIITKALAMLTLPLMGNDGLAEAIYTQVVPMYQSLLSGAVFDYDRGGDGTIDSHDRDVVSRTRIGR